MPTDDTPMSPKTPATPGSIEPTKRPEDTPFKQQRLPAWQPVMSPPYIIGCFAVIAIAFICIGVAVIVASDGVVEITQRYDQNACPWENRKQSPYYCEPNPVNFEITKAMKQPVYLYYKLENFYQNHRRYAKSRSDTQLSGGEPTGENLADCEPFRSPGQYIDAGNATERMVIFDNTTEPLDVTSVTYNPCGLIAWSMFNDTFVLHKLGAQGVSNETQICNAFNFDEQGNIIDKDQIMHCEKKGIAWPSDPGVRFDSPPPPTKDQLSAQGWPGADTNSSIRWGKYVEQGWYIGEEGHKIPSANDFDLMVWMRLASLSTFRKLHRKITIDLEPGSYRMNVYQAFDIRSFDGKKSFVLSTSSWIGGKNHFLGGLYIAVGGLCMILAIAFFVKHMTTPQRVSSL